MNKSSALDQIDDATGLSVREVLTEQFRRESVTEANTDPLPGPLGLAFPERSLRVGAFSIRPVVGIDIVILRQLNSPLIRQMAEAAKPKDQRTATEFSDEDGWEMCLQFLLSPVEAEAELKKGREQFREQARQRIGLRMNPVIIGQIVAAVTQQFTDAFATAVQFSKAEAEPPVEGGFFTVPPPAPKTASAGGLTTSAA